MLRPALLRVVRGFTGRRRPVVPLQPQSRIDGSAPSTFAEPSTTSSVIPATDSQSTLAGLSSTMPNVAPNTPPRSASVHGHESQVVSFELPPSGRVFAEPGALFYKDVGVTLETNAKGGILESLKRSFLMGESFFQSSYVNSATVPQRIVLTPSFPARVVTIPVDQWSGSVITRKGTFLASTGDYKLTVEMAKKITTGLFGGGGFVLQRYTPVYLGTQIYLYGGGVIHEQTLAAGEAIHVSPASVLCFEGSVHYDVERQQGVKNMLFGNGVFLVRLEGPGRVLLHSMPFERLVGVIASRVGGGGVGVGVPIGGGHRGEDTHKEGDEEGATEATEDLEQPAEEGFEEEEE